MLRMTWMLAVLGCSAPSSVPGERWEGILTLEDGFVLSGGRIAALKDADGDGQTDLLIHRSSGDYRHDLRLFLAPLRTGSTPVLVLPPHPRLNTIGAEILLDDTSGDRVPEVVVNTNDESGSIEFTLVPADQRGPQAEALGQTIHGYEPLVVWHNHLLLLEHFAGEVLFVPLPLPSGPLDDPESLATGRVVGMNSDCERASCERGLRPQ